MTNPLPHSEDIAALNKTNQALNMLLGSLEASHNNEREAINIALGIPITSTHKQTLTRCRELYASYYSTGEK